MKNSKVEIYYIIANIVGIIILFVNTYLLQFIDKNWHIFILFVLLVNNSNLLEKAIKNRNKKFK